MVVLVEVIVVLVVPVVVEVVVAIVEVVVVVVVVAVVEVVVGHRGPPGLGLQIVVVVVDIVEVVTTNPRGFMSVAVPPGSARLSARKNPKMIFGIRFMILCRREYVCMACLL